jgi:transcriptional regulator with XRE-family HTH domain
VQPEQRFGANAAQLRRASKLTQEELAHRSGLHTSEVSRLERGVKDPRLSTIVRLAEGLRVPVADLLVGIGRPR